VSKPSRSLRTSFLLSNKIINHSIRYCNVKVCTNLLNDNYLEVPGTSTSRLVTRSLDWFQVRLLRSVVVVVPQALVNEFMC
jgi:hypothetical protein